MIILKKIMVYTLLILIVAWTALTLFVEKSGPEQATVFGKPVGFPTAIIVYNPDPFYNLDQQVCEAFGQTLAANGWYVQVMSVAAAKKSTTENQSLYVFCANTYNWAPDWPVTGFIKNNVLLTGKKVVAITLGGGSTQRSQRVFENILKEKGAVLISTKTLWLWKPNDHTRLKESNTRVALKMTTTFAEKIVQQFDGAGH
ncbi:MAG: hypothetical protein ABIR15_12770 [Chitinophagaceae bacterium]